MQTIALIEPRFDGHRITYLKYYIEILIKMGHKAVVLCPDIDPVQLELTIEQKKKLHFIPFNAVSKKFRFFPTVFNKLYNWEDVSHTFKKNGVKPDWVFFMSLDTFNAVFMRPFQKFYIPFYKFANYFIPIFIDMKFRYPWSGIYLSPFIDQYHIFRARKNFAVGILEGNFKFPGARLDRKVIKIPDITNVDVPGKQMPLEKSILEKAAGRSVISLLGRIHKRKSVIALLEAAEKLKCSDYFFVIAGEPVLGSFSADEWNTLNNLQQSVPDNCYLHFERINDGYEFNSLVRISKILFASYMNFHHSSNLLTKSAYFKKPIIVSRNTYMGEMVDAYRMGKTVQEGAVDEIAEAIKQLDTGFDYKNARFDEYYALNTVSQVENVFEKLMNKQLSK